MCPACITTALLIAGSTASAGGGLAAVATKKSWFTRLHDKFDRKRRALYSFWKELAGGLHDRYHW